MKFLVHLLKQLGKDLCMFLVVGLALCYILVVAVGLIGTLIVGGYWVVDNSIQFNVANMCRYGIIAIILFGVVVGLPTMICIGIRNEYVKFKQ